VGSATASTGSSKTRTKQAALLGVLVFLMQLAVAQPASAATPVAPTGGNTTNVVTLDVATAINSLSSRGPRRGDAVKSYRWLLNLDNTGDPHGLNSDLYCHPSSNVTAANLPALVARTPGAQYVVTQNGYPQGCEWSSIRYAIASPVISEGTQDDWNKLLALPAYDATAGRGLPNVCPTVAEPTKACRYLVSVTADGYQIGGAHFTVPMKAPGVVKVWLNPYPIPLGTARVKVFPDMSPTDGTWDQTSEASICPTPTHKTLVAGEQCMAGFTATLNDFDGIVSQDFFGNPLCTPYVKDSVTGKIILDANGRPTPLPTHEPAPPDPVSGYYNPTIPGRCQSDTNGNILIPNIAPNRYDIGVTPYECVASWNWDNTNLQGVIDHLPNYDCGKPARFIQTSTLEGALDHDVWVIPDDTGFDSELVVGGEAVPWVQFGFVDPQATTYLINPQFCPGGNQPAFCNNPSHTLDNGTAVITGKIYGAIPYVPGIGALPGVGGANGQSGLKLDRPVDRGWVTVSSLDVTGADFDQRVATVPANADGTFSVGGLLDGSYLVTVWDQPISYAMDIFNVTIQNQKPLDLGVVPLLGWFARLSGHVFIDTNGNGRLDPGEQGLYHATVQVLNRTNNALEGAGFNVTDTNNSGYYEFTQTYPLGLMVINQYFNTGYKTTGITWQACNDPQEHTVIAPMVDVSFNPIIGHCGRIDWGVSPYDSNHQENGGIVATALYDQIRIKLNARQAQSMDYQTGIPGIRTEQYTQVNCIKSPAAKGCRNGKGPGGNDELTGYALNMDGSFMTVEQPTPVDGSLCDGASVVAQAIPCYMSENNGAPAQCYPRDANGTPIGYDALHPYSATSYDFMTFGGACVETGVAATQIGLGTDCVDGPNCHGVQTVDGNYAMPGTVGDPILHGDALVRMVSPVDKVLPATPIIVPGTNTIAGYLDRPLYVSTSENDTNNFSGAQYVPQGSDASSLPWPPPPGTPNQAPLGPLSSPDRKYQENEYTTAPGPDPLCAGPTFVVDVNMTNNPSLATNGGSPLQGATRHTCDWKIFHSAPGQSIAPNFHFHTTVDIPLPAHWWGYLVDDLSLSGDKKSTTVGDVQGIPFAPTGFYDWTGRRLFAKDSDYNGVYEALMPSSELFNCPTPAGSCPNVYRIVGNDPGQPNAANPNYNPAYRTITANFQAWPNMLTAVDTAPTHQVPTLEGPGVQFTYTSPCGLPAQDPQLFAVNKPYTKVASEKLTIQGIAFGNTAGRVTFVSETGGAQDLAGVTSWTDQTIEVNVGTFMPAGAGQLKITTSAGKVTTNTLTFHVITGDYQPHLLEVGPGKQFDPANPDSAGFKGFTIQQALDAAAKQWQDWGVDQVANHHRSVSDVANDPNSRYLVVVYPNTPSAFTPLGTYYENLIIHSPLKLQGVGPGGVYADGTDVQGSIIDGRFFTNSTPGEQQFVNGTAETGIGLDNTEPVLLHWEQILESVAGLSEPPPANPYPANTHGTTLITVDPEGGVPPWSGISEQIGEVGAGAVITVLSTTGTDSNSFKAGVDGFQISGGDQGGFTGNISEVSGFNATGALAEPSNELEIGGLRWVIVQGGAIYLNGGTDNFQITNNMVRQNSGAYASIRLGTLFQLDTPTTPVEGSSSHNYNTHIGNNTIAHNGGTNIGGAIAILDDSNGYRIDHNTFCQNFSAEYGGAISHFGYSPNGLIDHNRIFLNGAFDEGGAISVRSEPGYRLIDINPLGGAIDPGVILQAAVPDPAVATNGSGPVTISSNYISANNAQDDGGAIRIMTATGTGLTTTNGSRNDKRDHPQWGLSQIDIVNNMIVDNTSAHEGGAISIDDSPVVNIVNNTIAKNITTATALTSNGCPAPAGISTGANTLGLQAIINNQYASYAPGGIWPTYSKPLIQNDIFWDNRAGSWGPTGVTGIGLGGDTTPINTWDIGTIDGSGNLTATNSLFGSNPNPSGIGGGCSGSGYTSDASNKHESPVTYPTNDPITGLAVDDNYPQFAAEYDLHLQILQQRTYFRFRPAAVVSLDLPANAVGDYHLMTTGSPAQDAGANVIGITPRDDIDGNSRPVYPDPVDAGANQLTPTAVPFGGVGR
jgi:hypothetical protein